MTLIAVAPVVLGCEIVGLRVAEGERIALIVVVRLVERQCVVELELEVGIEHPLQADRDAIVARLGR